MNATQTFSVSLQLVDAYKFEVDFGAMGTLLTDELPPLGKAKGPNPIRLLAAAVANCLAASLLFAIRKFKEDPGQVRAVVSGQLERVAQRWRICSLSVTLQLGTETTDLPHLARALGQFENFCIVTQSVRRGIDVEVEVRDLSGQRLYPSP